MLIRAISITMCLWRLDAALARGSLVVCAPVFAELLAAPHLALLLYLNPSFFFALSRQPPKHDTHICQKRADVGHPHAVFANL